MIKSLTALLLLISTLHFSAASVANESAPASTRAVCFTNSQNIYPGTAAPGEYKVVHGPFTTRCATTMHKFQLRHQTGSRLPVTVEKLTGSVWNKVIQNEYDPNRNLGNGTFRMILDNTASASATPYRGSFSVPL